MKERKVDNTRLLGVRLTHLAGKEMWVASVHWGKGGPPLHANKSPRMDEAIDWALAGEGLPPTVLGERDRLTLLSLATGRRGEVVSHYTALSDDEPPSRDHSHFPIRAPGYGC